jgi:hypothetical protein
MNYFNARARLVAMTLAQIVVVADDVEAVRLLKERIYEKLL